MRSGFGFKGPSSRWWWAAAMQDACKCACTYKAGSQGRSFTQTGAIRRGNYFDPAESVSRAAGGFPYMNGFTHASLAAAHDPRLSQRKESAMTTLVGDFIIERLVEWGVHRIYGYPGDGINGLMGAMNRADGKVELVRARHEEMCAFMACAHAKFTGEVGVCMATSGPGAIHLLNGLYDAKLDHMPVVAIVGQQARSALGGQYQQEVDLTTLFKDVASEYVELVTVPAQVRHVVDRAMRIAISKRAVTCIIVPNDLQEAEAVEKPPRKHGTVHSGLGYRAPRGADRARPAASRRSAERGQQGGDPGGCRRARRARGSDRGRRAARRGCRQGAAGQGRAAGRVALRHRFDRFARDQAELGLDGRVRHAADDRLALSVFRIPAQGRSGARGADRHRPRDAFDPLSDGDQPRRRRQGDAQGAARALATQGGPRVARRGRRGCHGVL